MSQPASEGQAGPGTTPAPNAQLLAVVLKLLKMATGMRALLDTVVQALPQVGGQLPRGGHCRHPQEDKGAGRASLTVIHSFVQSA